VIDEHAEAINERLALLMRPLIDRGCVRTSNDASPTVVHAPGPCGR
jgi:hypothetical protein